MKLSDLSPFTLCQIAAFLGNLIAYQGIGWPTFLVFAGAHLSLAGIPGLAGDLAAAKRKKPDDGTA